MQSFSRQIGLMRFFRGIEPTDKGGNAVRTNSSAPTFATFKFRNAQIAACFVAAMRSFLILYVFGCTYVAQIIKTIITRISVYMVNIALRPFFGYIKPSKPTCSIRHLIYSNNDVAFRFSVSCNDTWNNFTTSLNPPSKNSSAKIVMQKRTQLLKSNFVFSHALILP